MDLAFVLPLLAVYSLFRLQLPFECISFFEKEGQRLFEFGNFSAMSRAMVVLVTIVTPHVGPLMILRILAYTTGNRFLTCYQ
jgi:hypothetical protein